MREFFRTIIRLLTGRVSYERRAALTAIQVASEDAWVHVYGDAMVAAKAVHAFLLSNGELP